MTQAPVSTRYQHNEDDRVRERQVPRTGDDYHWPMTSLFRTNYWTKAGQPDIARTQRLAHSLSRPSFAA